MSNNIQIDQTNALEYGKIEDEVIILTKVTRDIFLKKDGLGGDAFLLYLLYLDTGKWQRTNQVWASREYCLKKLGWGKQRYAVAKKKLIDADLIKDIKKRDKKNRITKHFIQIKYKMRRTTSESSMLKMIGSLTQEIHKLRNENTRLRQLYGLEQQSASFPAGGKQPTDAYSTGNIDTYSTYKDISHRNEFDVQPKEKQFTNLNPSKASGYNKVSKSHQINKLGTSSEGYVAPPLRSDWELSFLSSYDDEVVAAVQLFFNRYQEATGQDHPRLKKDQLSDVLARFESWPDVDYEYVIDNYLDYANGDLNINAMTDDWFRTISERSR